MPRLEFDSVKNGANIRKHGISLGRFGDMDFDAALVAEDVTHSTATETRWIYLGPDRWRAACRDRHPSRRRDASHQPAPREPH